MSDWSLTFAIMADSHVRPDEGVSHGDYPSNRLANDRNRTVIELINRLAPDLVFHLGDFVHPIPIMRAYGPAVRTAREIISGLNSDLHVTPGNHDVGDKVNAWVPAPAVDETGLTLFHQTWGPSYTSFDQDHCHFVLINSPVLNSGLALEAEQRAWLEADLAANREQGHRVFLFSHYPLFLAEPEEPEHYDNVGRPAREWLLSLLEQYQVEAVFSGHVHNFFYNRYHDTDLYVLPSPAFVRPGYSELFDVSPASEFGRNDEAKLGFGLVTVQEQGHWFRPIRSYGAAHAGEAPVLPSAGSPSNGDRAGSGARAAPLGVFLRQDWGTTRTSSFGNLDEFGRKRMRNDYLLWALWELGIREHRIPLYDLADDETRERIRLLRRRGHTFTVFSVGVPDRQTGTLLARAANLIGGWEVIVPWERMEAAIARIREIKKTAPILTLLSRLNRLADQPDWETTDEFDHFPRAGFLLSDQEFLAACLDDMGAADGTVDGFVLRLEQEATPWEGVRGAGAIAGRFELITALHVGLPRAGEGQPFADDVAIANRVAEAVAAAATSGKPGEPRRVRVFLDTLADHDRGYHPRHGLVDRRYNPRPAYRVLGQLMAGLRQGNGVKMALVLASEGVRSFYLSGEALQSILLLATGDDAGEEIQLNWAPRVISSQGLARWLDLSTGQVRDVNWRRIGVGDHIAVRLPEPAARFYPALFSLRDVG